MNSHTDPDFWALFRRLPIEIRRQAYQVHRLFERDPFHPSLHFKEINKRVGLWSARVTDKYRVLGYRDNDEIHWFWIGPHAEYEKLIGRH